MDDLHQRIHTSEFVTHMALHGAAPVWQHLFQTEINANSISAMQNHLMQATEPLTVDQVQTGVQQNLGRHAVRWMWDAFISTAVPRAQAQQATLQAFVRPTVAPLDDPAATAALTAALGADQRSALMQLEHLLEQLALLPPDPRDSTFIAATAGFIMPDHCAVRLTDSIYLHILSSVLPAIAARGH
jgi:hypothetical protein